MRVRVNGADLWFDAEGASMVPDGASMRERPVVLALHGGPGFDHSYLKPGLSALTDTAQIVYLDQRGQGRSGPASVETCTIEQLAEDAAAFCRAIGLSRPFVLGHSAGGFVALILALAHPDLVQGLILVGTAARFDLDESLDILERRHGPAARAIAETVLGGTINDKTLAEYARLVFPAYTHSETAAALEAFARVRLAPDIAAYFYGTLLPCYDLRSRLNAIAIPALVVAGDYDWITPPALARELADGIPGAELAVIPKCGHLPMGERPEAFAEIVRTFLRRETSAETAVR